MKWVVAACLLSALLLLSPGLPWGSGSAPDDKAVTPMTTTPQRSVAVDSSSHGHDGIIQGHPTLGLVGYKGSAYSFDDPGSWIQVPATSALTPGERDFLMSAWVNFDIDPKPKETYDVIRAGLAWSPNGGFKIEILDGGRVKCSAKDSAAHLARVVNSDIDVTDGRWHSIACARTAQTWTAVVDGRLASNRSALGSVGNTMPLSIGSKYGLEDSPHGRVDEVKVIVRAEAEDGAADMPAASLAATLDDLSRTPPVGWWRLDEPAS